MLRRVLFPGLCALLCCAAFTGAARAEMKQIQTARLHSQLHVDAAAAPIWAYATRGSNFEEWMPLWNRPRNARINLVKVGDWLQFIDEWNNKGRSVVTYIERNKELRLANDPEDGSFMCQVKLTLDPDAQGTMVHLYEQYTDESPSGEFNATARKVQAGMDRSLRSLKMEMEGRKISPRRRGAAGAERR